MAYNNTISLTGNLGREVEIFEQEGKGPLAAVSIATTDSYQDEKENWVQKDTIWHETIAFSPFVITTLKSLKKGTRVKATGSLSYRPFPTQLEDGRMVNKKEASIIVHKIELAPLVKKSA